MELFDFDDLFSEDAKLKNLGIETDLSQRIATVMDAERASELYLSFLRDKITEEEFDQGLEECVLENGMTKEEIENHFPPFRSNGSLSYNRKKLIKNIIWEEKELVGKDRELGNIRHFWYTNLMYTIMKTMQDSNISSITSSYGQALSELVKSGCFRYSDINLTSDKSKLCEALFEDSPYPNILIACEKEDYHQHLKRLAKVFQITYISLGGQGSYKVYEDLVVDFINAGIDINQEFHIFTISDFDPHGYEIQNTVKNHLECAGIRKVVLHRVYLKADQITKGIVERHAVPYVWNKGSTSATKSALTLYNKFGGRTGGIYKRDDKWERFSQNGDGTYKVPEFDNTAENYDLYRVELDNFKAEILLHLFIDALSDFIDGADYYYKKAHDFVSERFDDSKRWNLAGEISLQKVRNAHADKYESKSDLVRKLSDRSAEMVKDIAGLKEEVEETYRLQDEVFQDCIENLYSEISVLENSISDYHEEQRKLAENCEQISDLLCDVENQITKEIIDLSNKVELDIRDKLYEYESQAYDFLAEGVIKELEDRKLPVGDWVNFTDRKDDIFEAAREGSETFSVDLSYSIRNNLRYHFDDWCLDLENELIGDEKFSLPPETEAVKKIPAVIAEVLEKLNGAKESELSDRYKRYLSVLKGIFTDQYNEDIFEADDVYDFLDETATYVEEDDE